MIIAFVNNHKAFLPEIDAYSRFFSGYNITCELVNKNDLGLLHRHVEWWMMGTDLSKPKEGIFKVHEYFSSSVPPWRRWKNWSKSFFSAQPDFRLFLNEYVKKAYSIHDHIPFGYRDMGIPEEWLAADAALHEKEYDFVYTGDFSPVRNLQPLLNCFATGLLKDRSLLLIGVGYEYLQTIYGRYTNIVFMGPLPHHTMDAYILKARFGINYVTDIQPFNRQTSVKLLEYLALGLPVISTRYSWIEQFQQQYGGNYFFMEPRLGNFSWENITNFSYSPPDLSNWTWEKQIRGCGVLQFLESKFPELKF
jgi:glycosyltransferase involved in cell wall biosynthesis